MWPEAGDFHSLGCWHAVWGSNQTHTLDVGAGPQRLRGGRVHGWCALHAGTVRAGKGRVRACATGGYVAPMRQSRLSSL